MTITSRPPTHTDGTGGAGFGGAVLFARYAFGPNRYGLCGPDDWRSLQDAASAGTRHPTTRASERRVSETDRYLRRVALDFEGALPYLQLIAGANGIPDPLDARVVEAYWIGNRLTEKVSPALLTRFMDQRFRPRLRADDWRWLAAKPAAGARPTHAFHVLDVFTRTGGARGNELGDMFQLMDACRVRWGTVSGIDGDTLQVQVRPLEMRAGRLVLGLPRPEIAQQWLADPGWGQAPQPGDTVSLHWGWLCEVLSPQRASSLARHTLIQLAIANQTI